MHRLKVLAVLAVLGACALPTGAARADVLTQGSNLTLAVSIHHYLQSQRDTIAWLFRLLGFRDASSGFVAPADGQVTEIRLKGMALRPAGADPPLSQIHFQSLDALSDGTEQVYLSSAPFEIPYSGD